MKWPFAFHGCDPALEELGATTGRMLELLSEANQGDVQTMLCAIRTVTADGSGLRGQDAAALRGILQALELALVHGDEGEPMRPELQYLPRNSTAH